MKRVVSVSLGTSKRDKTSQTAILGETFQIERRGTDGDLKRFAELFTELDGQVDALGVGGCDIYVVVGERKYAFRQILSLVSGAKRTPVVDGSGLKHTLERQAILDLAERGIVDFKREKVLLVSAVDRYGMAQALVAQGADVVYGDLLFGLGLPIPIRSYRTVEWIGRLTLPIITRLPFKWFYPTGEKQEQRTPKHAKVFQEATFICGDWHFIRRYAPDRLDGKTVLTQTLRKADLDWLRSAGVRRAITTTPVIEGETFA
ncbi:MAG: quinate 5-dehydrogenase, partial [Nitrospirae bacterium]|nr:quinate 5-dehydrogenase [Fimbriimonadaceae bacterium]